MGACYPPVPPSPARPTLGIDTLLLEGSLFYRGHNIIPYTYDLWFTICLNVHNLMYTLSWSLLGPELASEGPENQIGWFS